MERKNLIFCGIPSRNIDEVGLRAAEAAEELTSYAMIGKFSAAYRVLNLPDGKAIILNPDITYFLQMTIDRLVPPGDELRHNYVDLLTPDAGEQLSPQRRKFVDDAFIRKDHQAVLDTTKPCKS